MQTAVINTADGPKWKSFLFVFFPFFSTISRESTVFLKVPVTENMETQNGNHDFMISFAKEVIKMSEKWMSNSRLKLSFYTQSTAPQKVANTVHPTQV